MKSDDLRSRDYPYSAVRATLSVHSCDSSGADSNGEALLSAAGPLYAVFILPSVTLGVVTGACKISPTGLLPTSTIKHHQRSSLI